MGWWWRQVTGAAAVLVVMGQCPTAFGQEADAELLRQGTEAYAHKDYEAARRALAEAYSLQPKVSTLLKLGVAEVESNHPVEATKHLREYLTHAEEPAEKRDAVRTSWLPRAEAQTARLEVSAPPGAEVLVDNVVQGRAPLGSPIVVAAGSHEVTSRQGTLLEKQTVSAAAGQVEELHFQRVSSAVAAAPAGGVATPGDGRDQTSGAGARTATLIALGTGTVVALGIGLGFGIASDNSASRVRTLDGQLAINACPAAAQCGELQQSIHATNDQHVLSMGFEIGAGVLAVATAATWLVWHPRSRQVGGVRVGPMVSGRGGGLTLASDW